MVPSESPTPLVSKHAIEGALLLDALAQERDHRFDLMNGPIARAPAVRKPYRCDDYS